MGTIFSAYDIRGRADDALSVEYAWTAGKAVAEYLPDEGSVAVIKAADVNTEVAHAFVEGILLQGRDVVDCGQGDEQAVIAAITDKKAAGGALISHDGVQNLEIIALYDASGASITEANGLTAISELVDSGNFLPAPAKGHLIS